MAHPRIVALATANPVAQFSQEELLAVSPYTDERRRGFFLHSGIERRHLYLDKTSFRPTETTDELNARYREGSIEIGCEAIRRALDLAACSAQEIDFLATTSCTGRLCPGLDAYFVREFRMKEGIQRVHVGDMGCASAMIALQQAYNHLMAFPDHRALIVSVEICSSTYFLDDSLETAVANAIFADGAAAALLGPGETGPALLEHHTLFRSEYLPLMGFTFPGGRPRILLSKDIRHIGGEMVEALATRILEAHGLPQEAIRFWVLHSAGRKVIDHARHRLGLREADVTFSRGILRRFGNVSSATVLFVLEAVMASGQPCAGDYGLMMALGPGFAAEGALLRW